MNDNPAGQKSELFPAQRAIFGALGLATLVLTLCTMGMSSPPPWYAGLAFGVGALVTFFVLAGNALLGMLAEIRREQVEEGRRVPPAKQTLPSNPAPAAGQCGVA